MNRRKPKLVFPGVSGPLLFGHRGFSHLAPENSLSAFRLLLEHNIPGVELDVHLCRSGELVVVHDDNLKRLCGFDGLVEETDYAMLKSLTIHSPFSPHFEREPLPLLSQVLELLGDRVYYDIELKTRTRVCGELETKVLETIRRFGMEERALISSFNPFSLKALRALGWDRCAIIYANDKGLPFFLRHGEGRWIARCPCIKPRWEELKPRSPFFKLLAARFPIISWTVDDPVIGAQLYAAGVTGLISNNPLVHLETMLSAGSGTA